MDSPDAPGWYDDPDDAAQLRYFDGIIWSERWVPKRVERPAPAGVAASGRHGGGAAGSSPAGGTHGTHRGSTGQGAPTAPAPGWAGPTDQPTTADGEVLASFGVRAAAYVLDSLVLGVLNLLLGGWAAWLWVRPYVEVVAEAARTGDTERLETLSATDIAGLFDWQWYPVFIGIGLVVLAGYQTLMVGLRGGGVGKLVLGLRVRATDRPGPPGLRTAFMRVLLPLGLAVVSNIPLVGYLALPVSVTDLLWPLHDERRQALHDKVAGTQVVRVR